MARQWLIVPALAATFVLATAGDDNPTPSTVLAELFTSEGCSSCPPADLLLQRLDKTQPVPGARIVVLSEHVDYWNSIGWKDPFSSSQFSDRQRAYAIRFKLDGPYTPQLVIDGSAEILGSDARKATAAISQAAQKPKLPLKIVSAELDDTRFVLVHVQAGAAQGPLDLLAGLADDSDVSSVSRGENRGHTLTHVAVVRTLVKIGSVTKFQGFDKSVRVPLSKGVNPSGIRVVAFLQQPGLGAIEGVASSEIGK